MGLDSTKAHSSARFHRRSSGFKLAGIATLAGIAGVILHFLAPPLRETYNRFQPSLAQICAAAGAACIWSAILLNFLWGLTSQSRYYVATFSAVLVASPIVFALPPHFGIAAAAIVALAGVALFFFELGLFIETSSDGIRRVQRFPTKASREIPWDQVEIVRTDLRRITTYGVGGHFAESENRLIVIGNGKRIVLNTTRYEAVTDDLYVQIQRAQPFAIASTLRRVKNDGAARLGPVELQRDAILIKRYFSRPRRGIPLFVHILLGLLTFGLWIIGCAVIAAVRSAKKPVRAPLNKIAYATFEKGSLLIVAGRKMYIPLRRVPNGIYFPELLDALCAAKA
jgi:hypothetical protein